MRLIREMPETAEQLVSGSLTLETMSTLSNHFRASKPSREVRRQLVSSAQNLSKRELEKKLGKPEMTAVYLKPELVKKLEELKIVFGMTSLERILEKLVDQALAQARVLAWVKEQKCTKRLEQETMKSEGADLGSTQREMKTQTAPPTERSVRQFTPPPERQPARQFTPPPEQSILTATPKREPAVTVTASATETNTAPVNRSRYVPKPVRRHLIRRDQARCAYVDPLTKRQCGETRHLEFDHVQPFARGGETIEANLRMLCANHNRFRARRMGFSSHRR
jgi:hypothetical protein